ncbi:MAG TPA: DNA repair protein RadC [Thermoanaerobaculia bacterium]|jgi:DNA repair protein RadC|nr:DNA repair protein RadC [Thermoanaerobaculia bacterium]
MTDLIRDLPRDDRPRERMFMHGPETLSDSELVAILLGSGMPGKNALQLSRELLRGGMARLRTRDPKQLEKIPGIGMAKIARVFAAFELSRRIMTGQPEDPPDFEASVIGRTLVSKYGHKRQEHFGAVFLDSRHRILKQREIYVGTVSNALVSTREIITTALSYNATAIVAYHNHPSGNPEASDDDVKFTKKLRHSLSFIDIELVDHLIIGAHRFHSMKEKGELDDKVA